MSLSAAFHLTALTRCEVVQYNDSIWLELTDRDGSHRLAIMSRSAREFEALAEAATQAAELMRRRDEAPGLVADRLEPHRVGACDNRASGAVPLS